MKKVDLKTYLGMLRAAEEDVDLFVDGIDSLAYCGTELTEEGEAYFNDCLTKCYIEDSDNVVMWDSDDTDDEDGIPECAYQAWELITAMAGYCPCDLHEKWFVQD